MSTLRLASTFLWGCAFAALAQPSLKIPPGAGGCQQLDLKCIASGKINTKDSPEKQAAEKAQNLAKNNFCLSGTPTTITFDTLEQLQSVASGKEIVFGKKGPTPDRAVLKDLIDNPSGGKLGEGQLVQLTAFVFEARQENAESVNCEVKNKAVANDIHISLTPQPMAVPPKGTPADDPSQGNECFSAVAEMSPHFRPTSWNPGAVNDVAEAKLPVRVTGHLFFDSSHEPCNVSGPKPVPSPGNPKRMTLWEIHPIYSFEVCTSGKTIEACSADTAKWVPIETFAAPAGKQGKK
jgi:hypothetical protein